MIDTLQSLYEDLKLHHLETAAHCMRVGTACSEILPGKYNGIELSPELAFIGANIMTLER